MRLTSFFAVAAVAATAALAAPAGAADLDVLPVPPPVEVPSDFGSGWYLRGDAAYSLDLKPDLVLGAKGYSFTAKDRHDGFDLGAGFGYKLNSYFRFDVTGDYLSPYSYRATVAGTNTMTGATQCCVNLHSRLFRWDVLANAYVDLGTWAGFTPYVGAGAGASILRGDGTVDIAGASLANPVLYTPSGTLIDGTVPHRQQVHFAWAAMGGLAYAVSPHMLIDLGYRYLDLGPATVSLYPLASTKKDLTSHQIRLGLRYMID